MVTLFPIGLVYERKVLQTKYGFSVDEDVFNKNINRLTNQLWKLIPMKENEEDWLSHLDTMIIELSGLNEIFSFNPQFLKLMSKLEGLKVVEDIDFKLYRKTVFETISLLRGMVS